MATVEKTQSFRDLTALRDAEGINNSRSNVRQYTWICFLLKGRETGMLML
jgi:hypothetical protein